MSGPDLDNPIGTLPRLVLLGVTVAAVIVYALDGQNLWVLLVVAAVGLLYIGLFRGVRRLTEALLSRWR